MCLRSTFGDCCSEKGYCGGNLSYCAAGCQRDFGHCSSTNETAQISIDGSCGGEANIICLGSTFGDCCSPKGYCGAEPSYCDAGCQTAFGTCSFPPPSQRPPRQPEHQQLLLQFLPPPPPPPQQVHPSQPSKPQPSKLASPSHLLSPSSPSSSRPSSSSFDVAENNSNNDSATPSLTIGWRQTKPLRHPRTVRSRPRQQLYRRI